MNRKLLDLPVELIDPGTNVRSKIDTALRESILTHGVLQPITVSIEPDDRYRCLYGHRRLAAARAAGLKTIPAIVEGLPDALPIRQLVENLQRREVDPMDVARTLRDHLEAHPGLRQGELARALGRSTHWVSTRLTLLDMTPELQERLSAGEIRQHQALAAHKATTEQPKSGRPRTMRPGVTADTARVVVELEGVKGRGGSATIELDRRNGSIEILLEDNDGYGVALTVTAAAAALLSRRLAQAAQATARIQPAAA